MKNDVKGSPWRYLSHTLHLDFTFENYSENDNFKSLLRLFMTVLCLKWRNINLGTNVEYHICLEKA